LAYHTPIEALSKDIQHRVVFREHLSNEVRDPTLLGDDRQALDQDRAETAIVEVVGDLNGDFRPRLVELVEAVRRAAVGESYLTPRLGARMASEPPPGPPDDLSEHEVDVLRLIALGHTNTEIAEQLFLSVRTVETHRSHIQQKLRLSTRAELVDYALKRKLINTSE
jgi:DNA-binding NarL/FixJ family response regulator